MIIAHFIYRSGQCWLEHAKDFYLEMSGPPARSWPGVTRLVTAGRASRLRPNARRNLRRTIASQAELGAERQNSRCYSSMTGSLQKTTFFQTSFANCFLRSALCPPRLTGICPGKLFGLQKIFTERPAARWKISPPIYPITASGPRRGYYQLQSGHDLGRIMP